MPLRDAFNAELAQRGEPPISETPPDKLAIQRLVTFAQGLPDELAAVGVSPAEVELFNDELRVDTGPLMMIVRAKPTGAYRLTYEIKAPDDYNETEVPGTDTLEQLEAAMARLLAEHR